MQKLFTTIEGNGYIYLNTYTGAYCVSDEAFVDVPVGSPCPECGNITEQLSEENFYFKLSAFQDQVLALIESNELLIQPETLRNEVLSFVRSGLKDLSISRTSIKWGIPVPGHPEHVIYVWLDALANYMTAVGYGSDDPADVAKFARYWPADLHLIGKEIARFHCVYWPAFLLAAKLPLPKTIAANGWLLFQDSKMSKSKGNVVRIETILDAFGTLCPAVPKAVASQDAAGEAADKGTALGVPSDVAQGRASLKGTALAVPSGAPGESAALAAEGRGSVGAESVPQGLKPVESSGGYGTAEAVPLSETGAAAAVEASAPTKAEQDLFASDVLRYFLLREIPFGQDGNFSLEAMVTRYNADLANGYGNLVSRTLKMIQSYFDGMIPEVSGWEGTTSELGPGRYLVYDDLKTLTATADRLRFSESELEFSNELSAVFQFLKNVDGFISNAAPWKLAAAADGDSSNLLRTVLYTAAESIRIITALLYPILPFATASVWRQLGLGEIEVAAKSGELKNLQWGGLKPGTKLGPLAPIFPRADKKLLEIMNTMEQDKNTPIAHANAQADASTSTRTEFAETSLASESFHAEPTPGDSTHPGAGPRTSAFAEANPGGQVAGSDAHTTERGAPPSHAEAPSSGIFAAQPAPEMAAQIGIEDFAKVELRVAQIVVAERIPKADKLLRLEVDLGFEKRQILSGIAEWYTPEELIGRKIVVITNLAPRKMRGLESHGMLLAASAGENGKPVLATFGEEIALGSRLK